MPVHVCSEGLNPVAEGKPLCPARGRDPVLCWQEGTFGCSGHPMAQKQPCGARWAASWEAGGISLLTGIWGDGGYSRDRLSLLSLPQTQGL